MDNNELDKILKARLQNTINPSQEFTNKVNTIVNEQRIKEDNKKVAKKVKKVQGGVITKNIGKIILIPILIILIVAIFMFLNNQNILVNKENNVAVIMTIEPTKLESGIIAKDSEFIIKTEGDESVESVQKSIYIEPALDYTITKTQEKEYKLTFKQNIPDNTILKLEYIKNQITENSWAYQTSNKFSITSHFPINTASINTVIEIEFSYADIENFEENVDIEPNVEGIWSHIGNTYRFVPNDLFEVNTTYMVTINKDVKHNNQSLDEDYKFSFKVEDLQDDNYANYYHISDSLYGIDTFAENDLIRINYTAYNVNNKIENIEIYKFENINDFEEYLENETYKNAKSLGKVEFNNKNISDEKNYIDINKKLDEGYYIASIRDGNDKELFNSAIQINNLQAYVYETQNDIVAWVAKDGNLQENIEVSYQNITQKTNKEGIAKLKNTTDSSKNKKYIKIGNEKNKLLVGINNFSEIEYQRAYLYTDRPFYKNTDTINIFGFVPLKLYENVEDEFYIKCNDEGKKKIKLTEDGVFNYKEEIKNYIDTYYEIVLYYKDIQIGYTSARIENYELQNYSYEITMNRNYGYVGEEFEFDVKVKHITGIVVPNKNFIVKYNNNTYKAKTNSKGVVHCKVTLEDEDKEQNNGIQYSGICIYNGDQEEYNTENAETYKSIYVLDSDIYIETNYNNINKEVTINTYKLKKDENITIDKIDDLYDSKIEQDIEIYLVENIMERYIESYEYNEYTKEQEPKYEWKDSQSESYIKTIKTSQSDTKFNIKDIKLKDDTEDKRYYYRLKICCNNGENKIVTEEYIYNDEVHDIYGFFFNPWCGLNSNTYAYVYVLAYEGIINEFNIGDTIKFNLGKHEGSEYNYSKIDNKGKILRIVSKQNVTDLEITQENDLEYVFKDDDFPGCNITGAYFINGKFYKMPVTYFDFNEQTKIIDIEIKQDKEKYKPGEEVTLNIKTTNNNNPIEANVNVSVVNEAVFELLQWYEEEEVENELRNTIYADIGYPAYTFSSYLDYNNSGKIFTNEEGGGGGGGDIRANFGDTAYFDTIKTNKKGEAVVKFKLPDNVTTYRVTAHAVNKDLFVGVNKKNIVSTLDFFIQCTEPRNLKSADDVVLNASAISEEDVEADFEFYIKEIDKTLTAKAKANSIATVNFGKLKSGIYTAVIKGKYEDKEDAIEYKFEVKESTQIIKTKATVNINENAKIKPTKNPIILEVYNKNLDQYIKYMDFIENTVTKRLDTQVAYYKVQDLKNRYYGYEVENHNIEIYNYYADPYFPRVLSNLPNGSEDLLLESLINYYAKDMYTSDLRLSEEYNVYEYYLYLAAKNKPVLTDLKYLAEVGDTDNYNKLICTLAFEFLGDYNSAREVYQNIQLDEGEKQQYASIIALIDTFINKQKAIEEINSIIENNPADEYVRFAILSFFENNPNDLTTEEVTIKANSINEKVIINGMEVKTYTLYMDDLSEISFETTSDKLMATYYYQTSIEYADSENIEKSTKISLNGEIKKGKTITLNIDFKSSASGDVRIALPNSLRLAKNYTYNNRVDDNYYLKTNKIDYIVFYKKTGCTHIEIPLLVTLDGNYKFESVIFSPDEEDNNEVSINSKQSKKLYISPSIDF